MSNMNYYQDEEKTAQGATNTLGGEMEPAHTTNSIPHCRG